MKARYCTTSEHEIRQAVKQYVDEQRDAIYAAVEKDCSYQALATAFYILHRDFGFGGERLTRLKNAIEDEYLLMDSPKHYDYSPRDVQAFLKERYGIDFNESQYGTNQEGGSK